MAINKNTIVQIKLLPDVQEWKSNLLEEPHKAFKS